jgi:hypothetical protein
MTGTRSSPGSDGLWLIVKRQLYFRPDCKGYTGIKDEAGRYPFEFAKDYDRGECKIIREEDGPEFMPAAYNDLVINHLTKQRDEARAEVARLSAAAQAQPGPLKAPQYIIEGIILRRLHEKRIEGYTIETAKEIAEALALPSTEGNSHG